MTEQTGTTNVHPHLKKTTDFHKASDHWWNKVNRKVAIFITSIVGTMWCAYAFAAISISSLPSTLALHSINADVQWVAQTFLQLVLLAVILVGQNIGAVASDERAVQTYQDTEQIKEVQAVHSITLNKIAEKLDVETGL